MKLSERQEELLREMADGATVALLQAPQWKYFLRYRGRPVHMATVHALVKQGALECDGNDWHGAEYALSPAGREARGEEREERE